MNKCNNIFNPPNLRISVISQRIIIINLQKNTIEALGSFNDNFANMFVFQPIMTAFIII